ncbi:hypothetical protein M0813_05960 [Anaeramoeba flamelloides]|uniref:Uncharacterized protein n=1 Tax=Anaeramoeba flamelloides TaxID=1746091 RepID=A0AAV7YEN5_9EUKA|nr:hypothetical protein M0812_25944 [Anaeramoeba flamelloides]KAJ6231232.1 hypothetical protein M0813_05960 [Anaeramoeba flamelloides]
MSEKTFNSEQLTKKEALDFIKNSEELLKEYQAELENEKNDLVKEIKTLHAEKTDTTITLATESHGLVADKFQSYRLKNCFYFFLFVVTLLVIFVILTQLNFPTNNGVY